MLHLMSWFGIALVGLFFAATGACMLVSPRTYFDWVGRLLPRSARMGANGYGARWKAIQIWTRVRGAMLLVALLWVAYQGFLKIKGF